MGRCVVCPFTVCSTGRICVLDPRRVPELTPQWRCSCMWRWCDAPRLDGSRRRGWRNFSVVNGRGVGLARNPPASTSLQALLLLLVVLLVVVVVEVTVVYVVLLLRPPLLSILWLLSAALAMTHVQPLLCSHRHDGGYWWWWWWSLVHIALFSALQQTDCGAAFVACNSIEKSDCRFL